MMAVHTHAPPQSARLGPGRKAVKQLNERLRREQRELAREIQERAVRQTVPRRDDGPLPRID